MQKESVLPEANMGLVGHVDSGKTTLVAALTGKWTALHSEELKRGITIKLGYADLAIRKCPKCPEPAAWTSEPNCPKCKSATKLVRKISFIDAPGHETLMAIMVCGAAIMDGALLLVAANELCPQPQTREHLMVLKILGIKNVIVVQNKIDLVSKQEVAKNYEQIKSFVKASLGFEAPIIPVSAQKKVNVDVLIQAIQEFLPTPERELKKDPQMLIARSFDVNKPGTEIEKLVGGVLGGAITRGQFKKGEEIEIKPGLRIESKGRVEWVPVRTTLYNIVCGGQVIDQKGPGGSVAFSTLLDPNITKGDSLVGNTVGLPGKLPPTTSSLLFELHLFEKVVGVREELKIEPVKMYEPLMISAGTTTTLGTVQQTGKKVRVSLKKPVCTQAGDKIAISRQVQNRWRLIGYGVVL